MKTITKIILSIILVVPFMAMAIIYNNPTEIIDNSAELSMPMSDDAEAGKALYTSKACFACHGMNGEGNQLGPNLTDDYGKNACDIEGYINVIKKGVPGTAMVSYEAQLKPEEIKQLAAFVASLKGTNPANAKAPEGKKCD